MSRFYNISKEEMEAFLFQQGFKSLNLPGVSELVYGKIVHRGQHRLSLRVYTGINPSGESRAKGSDAIRIQFYYMYDGHPLPIGRHQKCLRVNNWQANMLKALEIVQSDENYVVCPKCGHPKVIREGRTGEFWGCVTYFITKCDGKYVKPEFQNPQVATQQSLKIEAKSTNKFRIPDHQISVHQKGVEEVFLNEKCHIIVGARAGSGKTAMLRHLASFQQNDNIVYLAFNKKNAVEAQQKLPRRVSSRTTHSFCNQFIRKLIKLPERNNESKTYDIMENIYPGLQNSNRRRIRKAAFKMVDLSKNFAVMPGDKNAIREVMQQYVFELESDEEVELVINIVNEVLEKSLPENSGFTYDFNDLLWWPVVLNLDVPKVDIVLADECQDFNACQIHLLMKLSAKGARIIAVGDPYQAVYRFRGADSDAFDKLKVCLSDTPNRVKELLLPTNYRCGRVIIDYVRTHTIVKDIEAAPNAIDGEVKEMSYSAIIDMLALEMKR